jgi:acyl-CoA synthetase (AMP-forming)/AMP-acid ligase II
MISESIYRCWRLGILLLRTYVNFFAFRRARPALGRNNAGLWSDFPKANHEAKACRRRWEALARAAAEYLARYKHPRAYVALDAVPRNPQGKIGRAAVRALVEAR